MGLICEILGRNIPTHLHRSAGRQDPINVFKHTLAREPLNNHCH
jgi:hypothetical protein